MNFIANWKKKTLDFIDMHSPEVENKVKEVISKAMEPTAQRWLKVGSFALTGIALFGSMKGVKATELIFEGKKPVTDAISIVIDHYEVVNTYNYYPQKSCGGCGGGCKHDH